jgi:hypothetical protein
MDSKNLTLYIFFCFFYFNITYAQNPLTLDQNTTATKSDSNVKPENLKKIEFNFAKDCGYDSETQTIDYKKLNENCDFEWLYKNANSLYFVTDELLTELLEKFEGRKKNPDGTYSQDNFLSSPYKEGSPMQVKPGMLDKLKKDGICIIDENYETCYARIKRMVLSAKLKNRDETLKNNKVRVDMYHGKKLNIFNNNSKSSPQANESEPAAPNNTIMNDLFRYSQKIKKVQNKITTKQPLELLLPDPNEVEKIDEPINEPIKKSKQIIIEDEKAKKHFGLENQNTIEVPDNEEDLELNQKIKNKYTPKDNSQDAQKKELYLKTKYQKDKTTIQKIKKDPQLKKEEREINLGSDNELNKTFVETMENLDKQATKALNRKKNETTLDKNTEKKVFGTIKIDDSNYSNSKKTKQDKSPTNLNEEIIDLLNNSIDPTETK